MKVSKKSLITIGSVSTIIVVLTLLYIFNPVETPFAPKCIFHELTGWSCSGCGMQRFLHAFMHGRFVEAFSYNYMLILIIPYTILFGLERLVFTGKLQQNLHNIIEGRIVTYTLIAIAPCWMIIRNILHI